MAEIRNSSRSHNRHIFLFITHIMDVPEKFNQFSIICISKIKFAIFYIEIGIYECLAIKEWIKISYFYSDFKAYFGKFGKIKKIFPNSNTKYFEIMFNVEAPKFSIYNIIYATTESK